MPSGDEPWRLNKTPVHLRGVFWAFPNIDERIQPQSHTHCPWPFGPGTDVSLALASLNQTVSQDS